MSDKWWNQVRDFHIKFKHPYSDIPKFMDNNRAKKRYKWMLEEIDEFLEARDTVDQVDAMIDLIYFAIGTLVEVGVKPDEVFEIVHDANMSKLWEDGKPHYNEDGKTIKPSTWIDPYPRIKEVIEKKKC